MLFQYFLLFAASFGAATILPFYSEILLVSQLRSGLDPFWLWFFASLGNTLGAGVNWWLGERLVQYSDRRWFPARQSDLLRAQNWFNRYGQWTLLMTWLPVGGDALTVIGGMMRVPALQFFLLVGIGKSARYALLILGYNAF
ncbi:putative membrane protein [Spongiibacter sp. IMCC21906]|jgi:membrane protein YqaA with SNARE-associated domain|uniref:YqaA family protein n=1 Tax=Spongiibacter sp. IMCC21906 TaxID=1620392 RepID=UPI00062DD1E4|nr:YqaA family protein [Spongiibacter sp. IMCC21906]AKH70300.1 putative membrane protein [Spongiibacter sp. IMCC21906]